VVPGCATHPAARRTFRDIATDKLYNNLPRREKMAAPSKEAGILLAIEAMQRDKKLSRRKAAAIYNIPEPTLRARMKGRTSQRDSRHPAHRLTPLEEEAVVQYIIKLDSRGFAPHLAGVEDMANLLLAERGQKPVGKNWAQTFVKRQPELRTRFNRVYDFQRALCEDPGLIDAWFKLVHNMRAKYGIQDCDFYNFDETGFMMGVICASMVVTRSDRRGRGKAVQPGNREWATVIECINGEGWYLPPYIIVQGTYHLASWYTESDLPLDWAIKPTSNGWTNNETGLDWIKHFDKHTRSRTKGVYRMMVVDGHESHQSAEFNKFCDENNIIPICLPAHSSHLTQPLDVGCFSVLKRKYGREIEHFVKAHINHITKVEFFLAFKAAHHATMTESNNKGGFRGAGLVPFDPEAVISKLDVKLRTPTPGPPSSTTGPWVSQTPQNPTEAVAQSELIKNRIARHQGSSPTPILTAVDQLAKGTQALAHSVTLLTAEVCTLRKANEALSKRRRAKKTRVQLGGSLTVEDAQDILAQKDAQEQAERDKRENSGRRKRTETRQRRCGTCGMTGHNARTCQEDV
jgi:hypothetical protein